MKDKTIPVKYETLIAAQAGQILVGLGELLNDVPDLCESGTNAGQLLVKVGGKLKTASNNHIKITGRIA
jgi:hypothetical protein